MLFLLYKNRLKVQDSRGKGQAYGVLMGRSFKFYRVHFISPYGNLYKFVTPAKAGVQSVKQTEQGTDKKAF